MKLLSLFFSILLSFSLFAKEPIILSKDNSVVLDGEVSARTTSDVIQKAMQLYPQMNLLSPNKEKLYLILNTPGGEIVSGLHMIDTLNTMFDVDTIVIGAASMGFIMTQMFQKRYIMKHGTLMSHKAAGGFRGEFPGQIDSRYDFWLRRIESINRHVVKRTKGIHTIESYNKLHENEYWCEGQDCINQGFADEIANVVCDSSLNKLVEKTEDINFFGSKINLKYQVSECPLVTGKFYLEVTINGKPYNFNNSDLNELLNKKFNLGIK